MTNTQSTTQFKKQFPRNLFFQSLLFISRLAVGISLIPYLINHLGSAAYGLIPIAAIMTEYVNIISQSISGAIGRFLTIAIQKTDYVEANRIFNTAFFSYLILSCIQIPIFTLIIINSQSIMNIPEALYKDAIILFTCSATAFLINLATSIYCVPLYAQNRLDIARTIEIISHILRLVGIITLFLIFDPALRYVGYVELAIRIIASTSNIILGKIAAPYLKLNIGHFDWSKVKQLTTMGGWLMISYIGTLFTLRIDVLLCNKFINPEAAGEYAAVTPWSNYLRQSAHILSGVISPMALIYFARSEINNLIRMNDLAVRILALFFTIPVCILCVFSTPFLRLWLGDSYTHLAPLVIILTFHLFINLSVDPLFNIQTVFNKVKWPAIFTLFIGALNIGLAIFMITVLNWGMYGVAITSILVLTLKNAVFTPIYAAKILHYPWHFFFHSFVPGLLCFCCLIVIGIGLNHFFDPRSLFQLLSMSTIICITGSIIMCLILSKEDRQVLISIIPGPLKPLIAKLIESD